MKNCSNIVISLLFATLLSSCGKQEVASSGIDPSWMNKDINPGTDFYHYACGGWKKAHPIPDEYSRYSVDEVVIENQENQLRELIDDIINSNYSKGTDEQRIGDLYKLLMDSVRQEQEGLSSLRPYLDEVENASSRESLFHIINRLSVCGVPTFFAMAISADMKDCDKNIVEVGAEGLSLATKDYYLDDDSSMVALRRSFHDHIMKMFLLAGDSHDIAQRRAESVIAIETRMAHSTRSVAELRDPERNYNKMSYTEFKSRFSRYDWDAFFKAYSVDGVDELCVGQPETLAEGVVVVNDMPIRQLKDYIEWQLLHSYPAYIGTEFYAEDFDFFGRILVGQPEPSERWRRNLNVVSETLSMAVGKMYVQRFFPAEAKERIVTMVQNIKKALSLRIDAQDWMSAETKMNAQDKLAAIRLKIGYPDKWRSYDGLDIDTSLSVVENAMNISRWFNLDMVRTRLGKPVDHDEWGISPQTVNAFYDPLENDICFPAGILQPPYFDMNADDAYNYGNIGATIGHELTHGFDDEGRQFAKDGRLDNWWTDTDAVEFEKRIKVLSDYYDGLEVLSGLYIKGEQTIGENLADYGGLKISWLAYKEATKDLSLPVVDGLSADQRFFVSYAIMWAGNERDEYIRSITEDDVHSYPPMRVNGCLPHIDAWYKAFGITETDALYIPKEYRADIW